ncbi:MAG: hypothetical protein U0T83_02575 [Bacteriovoracaceae bacterium]
MKLFLFLFLIFIQESFATNCSEIWRLGYPDVTPLHTPVECDQFFPVVAPTTGAERYFTVASLTHNEAIKQQMEMIAEAVYYASVKYSVYGRVPPITVIREDSAHPNGGGSAAMGFTYVEFFDLNLESCPIFIYPVSEVLNKEHLQQMVAHEVFHCVQKVNYKEQVSHAVRSTDQGWWFEGLAQLFSNFVYPLNDFEYTSRFPAPDQTVPFFDQPNAYSSENFWQSYSNTLSDREIWNVMNLMPTSGGDMPATTVDSLPRISEALHNYAKEITLKKVRDASGRMSPYDMPFENHVLSDTAHQELVLSHYDYTVGAFKVRLPKAGKWNLHFNHPNNTKISIKKVEEESYSAVSGRVQITSDCENEREIQIVITRASADQAMNATTLVVDKEPNPECGCVAHPEAPPQEDRCLLGNWTLDHSSVAQFWNRINTNPRVEFVGSSGGFGVSFLPGFIGVWQASSWSLVAIGSLTNGLTMRYTRITQGASTFTYSANGSVACSRQTSSSLTARQIIEINGRVGSTTDVVPMDPSAGVFTYSCNETEFILRVFSVNGNSQDIEYVFHRI